VQQCSSSATGPGPVCGLAVMLADGHGSFAQPVAYGPASEIGAIVAADLNGDGNLDLVFATSLYDPSEGVPLGIVVLLGKGDGTFQPTNVVVPGVTAMGVADLNHDGKPDLAFTSASVSVALGNGDGTFASPVNYPATGGNSIAIGDVNGDGNEDIVVEGGSILFGDGKGGFPGRRGYAFGGGPGSSLILTDLDGDGKIDVVIAGGGDSRVVYGDDVTVFFGQGGGEFAAPPFLNITNSSNDYQAVLASGEFDGDGTSTCWRSRAPRSPFSRATVTAHLPRVSNSAFH